MAKGLAEILRFGRYEPLFRIGIGGMAEVYAARIRGEAGFQKLVAVKRMLPHLSGDQRFVDMFLDEARLAASITSPHVIQTMDLGRADDDSLYIVMELAVGVTLADIMRWHGDRHELVEPTIALELLAQAAQGLDDAHEARAPTGEPLHLVHRDISPQNILVGIDGRARVSDFGIAHAVYLRRTHTQVGEKKGKFSYFSPEQAFGKTLDRRSDLFSLGIVGWELLTGRRLFRGTMQEAIEAVRERPIPDLAKVRPDLPPEVTDTVMHALERNPEHRFATAAQMASSLRRAGLVLGEPPAPRAIGRFVQDVGGSPLAQMQERIASAGAAAGATGTALLPIDDAGAPLTGSHVAPLGSGDLIELATGPGSGELFDEGTDVTPSDTIEDPVHSQPTAPGGRTPAPDATTAAGKRRAYAERTPTPASIVALDASEHPNVSEDAETTVEEPGIDRASTRVMTPTNLIMSEATAPKAQVPWLVVAALALLVLTAGGGVAAWVVSQGDEDSIAHPLPEVAVPTVASEHAPEIGDEVVEPAPVEETVAAHEANVPDDPELDEGPAVADEPAIDADEARARERERRRRQAWARRQRPPFPEMRQAAAESMRTEPTPTPMRETTVESPTMRSGSPLPGLDAFDRSIHTEQR